VGCGVGVVCAIVGVSTKKGRLVNNYKNYTVYTETQEDLYRLYTTLDDLGLGVEVQFDKVSGDVVEAILGLDPQNPFAYVSFQVGEN
jgi:hypothetical protein